MCVCVCVCVDVCGWSGVVGVWFVYCKMSTWRVVCVSVSVCVCGVGGVCDTVE